MHNMLMDMHYSRREVARERQRQKMVRTLDRQMGQAEKTRQLTNISKSAERDLVNESTRKSLEQDLQRMNAKKKEELELQSTLIAMMHEKQQRSKSEGYRAPAAASTMKMTPSLMATGGLSSPAKGGAKSSSHDLTSNLHAAKHLTKPCGRPE